MDERTISGAPAQPGGCLLIAHRGESGDAPENTHAAIDLAWRRGDEAVEIDIRLTRDGAIVLAHDEDVARLTGQAGRIADLTVAQLRRLDVGRWKGPQWAGQTMPLLEEVLAGVPGGRRLVVEVKCGPEVVDALEHVVRASGLAAGQVEFIGFDPPTLAAARRRLPEYRMYLLAGLTEQPGSDGRECNLDGLLEQARRDGLDGLDVAPGRWVEPALVERVHQAGLALLVWTINDPAFARSLAAAGVDGITSDRAAWLRGQLAGQGG